ncbi:heparin lyase I family protein [Vibrio breoganii]|uniref:Polysaccharide lyase family 7 protein n=1 Tax=Vibrio breoganii TaxID=553239 RepID=A0ABX1UB01_9VIBR|nr:heparin lyase I family protein [Vibrio breoganii]NMO74155.1 hypothetical protein [Vibrio breoganii]NMR70900.1 hypothetical protein [Vibrio breoganii]PMF72613.1 hypothetical protein BCV08_02770 [Vibrio breoganii]PML87430.1 hypothetical protein BCT67_11795 [Vibrio breoganii]TKG24373.1 hypothetical protein FCV81_01895 [Vibrio breoganii]
MLRTIVASTIVLVLAGCGGSSANSPASSNPDQPIDETGQYRVISSTELNSDGPEGMETYDLIESVLGRGAIEAPDLYSNNDPDGGRHIVEEYDEVIGNHFKFIMHFEDGDRDKGRVDRQRNEIKAYDKSPDKLKGYLGKTFEYSWKFKIGDDLKVTKKFTHLFQLKAVAEKNSEDFVITSSPILTLTANVRSNQSGLEVRHVHYNNNRTGTVNNTLVHTTKIDNVDWNRDIAGQWIEAFVRVNYSESGSLYMTLTPLGESKPMIEITENNIETWRSGLDGRDGNFVRPKWGIYRSLKSEELLNQDQDEVYFADFKIREVKPVE